MIGIKKAVDSALDFKFYKIENCDFGLKGKFYIVPWSISNPQKNVKSKIKVFFLSYKAEFLELQIC
jgi:hypothetical protein